MVIASLLLCGCSRVDPELAARQAAKAMLDGEYEKGVDLARKAARAVPDNPQYGVLYGFALFETDKKREAKDEFERTVAAAPDSFVAQYFHGWVLWRLGAYGDAIAPLRNALRLKKGYEEQVPDAMVLLSRCCLEQNLPEGATYLQGLRIYRGFAEEPEVYNCLGMLHVKQGEYEQALRKFQEALRLKPENPVILQNIAVLYDTYFRDPKQAMVYYRESLVRRIQSKDPTNQAAIRDRLRQLARERRARD
jgi:tetratricopeptide (TPR) repeat protein